ncbi:Glycosyl transferase, group 2 family protein [Klebsiella quasipneumoniae subsp. similipneumoniae]|nr:MULTISPECIES: glycosyltransferase family A protein [Bacteria]MDU4176825.1 glycosyltransferase family A protein [Serratia liquefaciens]HBR1896076.1 glycosyltransferase family 2 protein [Klebsiella quasipneumoniae subsp. similipneumoniae]EKW2602936.1 glycosyltransferase family 2 protein [Klebsiella quasipneumoniae]ELJ5750378.1 glycosyltransferase family 2 protein [Klebsiella quasipneumoniae]MBC4644300.1 glycosyltransferase family 2 protein [Klebsiella quasipneumoniae]
MISVNLTTMHSRLDLCAATVWSIINQSVQPDKINLWISNEPYLSDHGICEIPAWVEELNKINNIVNVHYVKNTGPYRKIINAIINSEIDDILVYADDDVIYGRQWLEFLLGQFYENNCNVAIAARIRIMERNIFNKYKSYSSYSISMKKDKFEKDFIITGVGGCVLSKRMIKPSIIGDDAYLTISPKTDDIWISKMLEASNTKVESSPDALRCVHEILHGYNTLSSINTLTSKNSSLIIKAIRMVKNKFYSYFGLQKTNNDKSIKMVNLHFNGKL